MKQPPIGSYEEARTFAEGRFRRLSATQKLRWLAQMTAFINAANPQMRMQRLALQAPSPRKHRSKVSHH